MPAFALTAPRIFDGESWHEDSALLAREGRVEGIVSRKDVPAEFRIEERQGLLAPGFVDLQVNGGGGVLLNDRQDVEAIRTICAAHAAFGTTALLPTLITDTPETTARALAAGAEAARMGVAGFAGLHLEGPHLSLARKGAHDPALIRPMQQADLDLLVAARAGLPTLLVTVAPESVAAVQMMVLAKAGVIVSLGHTDTNCTVALECAAHGATMATHLFNAMSQLGNREPGLVGAVLSSGSFWTGLIADCVHVDPATIGVALRAKTGPGRIFLVTDAMSPIGTDMTSFTLNGRTIYRKDGRLTLADGTLAGADLDMISAVRFMHQRIGLPLEEALRMASLYPAQAIGRDKHLGQLIKGARADVVNLTDDLEVSGVWFGGERAAI